MIPKLSNRNTRRLIVYFWSERRQTLRKKSRLRESTEIICFSH